LPFVGGKISPSQLARSNYASSFVFSLIHKFFLNIT
jgi:hypothetical protein